MHAASIPNVVNSQSQLYNIDLFKLINKPKQLSLYRVLSVLDSYNIHIHRINSNSAVGWSLNQMDFFTLMDLMYLSMFYDDDYMILRSDIKPFRLSLAHLKRSTLEFNRLFLLFGIDDTNTFIDNERDVIIFDDGAIIALIGLLYRGIIERRYD